MPIPPLTDSEPSLNLTAGYAVQQDLVDLLIDDGNRVIGYKVGATSIAMQRQLGIDTPFHGPVFASTLYLDGDTIPLSRFIAPRVESEIALVVGKHLQGPGVDIAEARRAITGATAAMEIVDSRIIDWRIKLADTVADLGSSGAMVTSRRTVPLTDIDTRLIGMRLTRDGELIDAGVGSAVLGNPFAVVAWLANTLGERGAALEPGHQILTGALHAAVPLKPGAVFRAEFDRLGSVSMRVSGRKPE
ncbi:2-keto-4-pentenoate hydratase [Streptomyces sp. NBC_00258]|uniref:2-keto-4-pentenoate hydratase n=1 Tax=Streptomyces sp. NBC_00258 TaxID=2903642 RepID=UPI002E2A9132|nr:fumarylacetoacetate hydrolase family protein [Streptomyces sp. NBC_00258]